MNSLKKRIFLGFIVTYIGIVSTTHAHDQESSLPKLTIGSGSVSGVYFPTGGAICRSVNQLLEKTDTPDIHCSVAPSAGSVSNLDHISQGAYELGLAQSDIVNQAWQGKPPFKTPLKQLRSIASLYTETLTLVTRKDLDIYTLDHIRGKRISLGKSGSGSERTGWKVFNACGINKKDLASVHNLEEDQAANALRNKTIDVYLYVVGHPNENIWSLSSDTEIRFIPLTGKCLDTMVTNNPHYVKTLIPGSLYRGISEDQPTLGVNAVLMTSADVSEKWVYLITKALVEKIYLFKRLHPDFSAPNPKSLFEGLTVPLHLGAFRYFQELRVLEVLSEENQQSLIQPGVVLDQSGMITPLKLGDEGPFALLKAHVTVGRSRSSKTGMNNTESLPVAASSGSMLFWLISQ